MIQTNRTILCIILHFGNENDTWACIESIASCNFLDIVIADNDPLQKIELPDKYRNRARIVRTGGSASFAVANNMAVRISRNVSHESVFLLNNDTIALPNAVQEMLKVLDFKKVGAVGPCMPLFDQPCKIWACGGVIRKYRVTIHGYWSVQRDEPYDVDYLPGAAILCRIKVWDMVGGLPEKYFLAFEEAEFAIKIKRHGYRILAQPDAIILHKVGMSSDPQPMYIYNGIRNRLKFGVVLFGRRIGFLWVAALTLFGVRKTHRGFFLWSRAVMDELRGEPLNHLALKKIRKLYDQGKTFG